MVWLAVAVALWAGAILGFVLAALLAAGSVGDGADRCEGCYDGLFGDPCPHHEARR